MPGKPLDPTAVSNTTQLALDLTRVLAQLGVTSDQLENLTDESWVMAADIVYRQRARAGGGHGTRTRVHPPSEATRAAVATIFRDRDKNPDPFAGFPQQ
jgi:hypothetical protein